MTHDETGRDAASPTETQDRFNLHQIAELLDAPMERVRGWLREGGVQPVHPDTPEDYGIDAVEYVRTRMHQI